MTQRDFKFRAWDRINSEMLPVREISFGDDGAALTILFEVSPRKVYPENYVHGESGIVMQFTGLKDTNWKEIYEGDILEFVESHEKPDDDCSCEHCFPFAVGETVKVVWLEDRFGLLPADYEIKEGLCENCMAYEGLMSPNHEMDIGYFTKDIGKIYENPELLKVGNK
jgi:uncharacterized phage protein (TIGR01671 family)